MPFWFSVAVPAKAPRSFQKRPKIVSAELAASALYPAWCRNQRYMNTLLACSHVNGDEGSKVRSKKLANASEEARPLTLLDGAQGHRGRQYVGDPRR